MTEKSTEDAKQGSSEKVKKFLFLSKDEEISYEVSADEKDEEDQKKARNEAIKTNCKEALKSENLVILTGAGSSMDGGGKSVKQIWEEIFENQKKLDLDKVLRLITKKIEEIKKEEFVDKKKNLEELLSRLEIERKAKENKGKSGKKIADQIKDIKSEIKRLCSIENIDTETKLKSKTHQTFLTRILAARKKTSPRAKIFTLNYDTFFEDAASEIKAVVIDGFCFNEKRIFNSTDFDLDIVQRENSRIHKEENFYDKVFHLYKMHGSVTWQLAGREIKKLDKSQIGGNEEPLLIYPNASKFEESYQMPFYEMISRFQISLRATNTTLMIIGYSFGDAHVNRMIEEAVDSNLSLKVIVVDKEVKESGEERENLRNMLINHAKNSARIMFFGATFKDFVEALPEISYENEREKTLKEALDEALNAPEKKGENK